jgi:hypothetical protein
MQGTYKCHTDGFTYEVYYKGKILYIKRGIKPAVETTEANIKRLVDFKSFEKVI